MKIQTIAILCLVIASACSPSKYAFNFQDHRFYNGDKNAVEPQTVSVGQIDPALFTASTNNFVAAPSNESSVVVKKNLAAFSSSEQKIYAKEVKSRLKAVVKQVKKIEAKSVQAASGMDNDLKMAAIFGAIGIVLGALLGINEILGALGAIAIIVALVFLIKWIIRQ